MLMLKINHRSSDYLKVLTSILIVLFTVLSILSCNCHKNVTQGDTSTTFLSRLSSEKYGNQYKIKYNKPKDYVFVSKVIDKSEFELHDLAFFVFEIKSNKIVVEDTLSVGSLRWVEDYLLLALERGQQAESATKAYNIDVKTGAKTILP